MQVAIWSRAERCYLPNLGLARASDGNEHLCMVVKTENDNLYAICLYLTIALHCARIRSVQQQGRVPSGALAKTVSRSLCGVRCACMLPHTLQC